MATLFSEDFESDLSQFDGTVTDGTSTIAVSTDDPKRDTQNLKIVIDTAGDPAYAYKQGLTDVAELWLRFYACLGSGFDWGGGSSFRHLELKDSATDTILLVTVRDGAGSGGQLRVEDIAENTYDASEDIPFDDDLHEIVLHWAEESSPAAGDGVIELWLDGVQVIDSASATTGTTDFDGFAWGVTNYITIDSGLTLYFDDLLISDTEITPTSPAALNPFRSRIFGSPN